MKGLLVLFFALFLIQLLPAQRDGLYNSNQGYSSVQIGFLEDDSITYQESGCMGYNELVKGTYVKKKSIFELSLDIPPNSNERIYYYRTGLSIASFAKTEKKANSSIKFIRGKSIQGSGIIYLYDSLSQLVDSLYMEKEHMHKITLSDTIAPIEIVVKIEELDYSAPFQLSKDSSYLIIVFKKIKPMYAYLEAYNLGTTATLFEPRYPANHKYKIRKIRRNSFELLNLNSFKLEWRKFYRRRDD